MNFYSSTFSSPIGYLFALANDTSLLFLDFSDSEELPKKIKKIIQGEKIIEEKNKILEQAEKELEEYFSGKRKDFSLPLAFFGTDFQEKSWKALTEIPYGETRNYLEQAVMVRNPKAVRAIGGANHVNPIVIVIPCHRVIGKSGKLVGYGGGMERKKWLLEHEKNMKESLL